MYQQSYLDTGGPLYFPTLCSKKMGRVLAPCWALDTYILAVCSWCKQLLRIDHMMTHQVRYSLQFCL